MAATEIFLLGELFEQVQLQKIFSDGKTFVDCRPRTSISEIQQRYEEQKKTTGFSLDSFVHEYFEESPVLQSNFESDRSDALTNHLGKLWNHLKRTPSKESHTNSLIELPYPYIVPGGRFREIYYWDSYFTMLGLVSTGHTSLVEQMISNFSFLIEKYGYIPNGNRTYFLGRSQPPFFSCMVELLANAKGQSILSTYLPALLKEYEFWMQGAEELNDRCREGNHTVMMDGGEVLNRYWDENDTPRPESYREDVMLASESKNEKNLFRNLRAACESGWDFSSRWLRESDDLSTIQTIDLIPIDLNCLLYHLEMTIAKTYQSLQNEQYKKFEALAVARKLAIEKYCWNEEHQFYFDYNHNTSRQTMKATLAAAFPLFFQMSTLQQATGIKEKLEKNFLKAGGVVTTNEVTGQQWDAPNGWAPLQWITIKGLMNYQFDATAANAAQRWMHINETVFQKTGRMMEKYNVEDLDLEAGGGEYSAQDGFGWTNGVYLKLYEVFGKR